MQSSEPAHDRVEGPTNQLIRSLRPTDSYVLGSQALRVQIRGQATHVRSFSAFCEAIRVVHIPIVLLVVTVVVLDLIGASVEKRESTQATSIAVLHTESGDFAFFATV